MDDLRLKVNDRDRRSSKQIEKVGPKVEGGDEEHVVIMIMMNAVRYDR